MKSQDKLFQNYIIDLQKKKIDKFDRAEVIQSYIKEHKLSIRGFSKRFNLAKSTVEDWLLLNKISRFDMAEYKRQGLEWTEIYRLLRASKKEELLEMSALDNKIVILTNKFNSSSSLKNVSKCTVSSIQLLERAINSFKFRLEKEKGVRFL